MDSDGDGIGTIHLVHPHGYHVEVAITGAVAELTERKLELALNRALRSSRSSAR